MGAAKNNERHNRWQIQSVEALVGPLAHDDHARLSKMSPALLDFFLDLTQRAIERALEEVEDKLEVAESEAKDAEEVAARTAWYDELECPNCGETIKAPEDEDKDETTHDP